MLFLACSGKWDLVSVGMGGLYYSGLNDKRIEMVMRFRKVKDQASAYQDLRVMEAEAKVVLNQRAARK